MARTHKAERRKTAVELLYECHFNRNVGRINAILEHEITVNVNAGHGGGDVRLPLASCYGFRPTLGDRVLLCVTSDGHPKVKRLNRTRQRKH